MIFWGAKLASDLPQGFGVPTGGVAYQRLNLWVFFFSLVEGMQKATCDFLGLAFLRKVAVEFFGGSP